MILFRGTQHSRLGVANHASLPPSHTVLSLGPQCLNRKTLQFPFPSRDKIVRQNRAYGI